MNEENAVIDNTLASEHPVLSALNAKIAQLETKVASLTSDNDTLRTRWMNSMSAMNKFEQNLREILIDQVTNGDEEIAKSIANAVGIELTISKKFEVNVTFTIDVELEIGEDIDPDWDFDFTVSSDKVIDYSSDVVWSNEVS